MRQPGDAFHAIALRPLARLTPAYVSYIVRGYRKTNDWYLNSAINCAA